MAAPGNSRRDNPLSPDEIEIITHLIFGRSREATARRVRRSTRQVQRKVAEIRRKLGVDNDLQMAIVADRLGLIDHTAMDIPPAIRQ